MQDLIEQVAKYIAAANNGGGWSTHYTEGQKDVWRARAKEVIEMVKEGLVK
jgi:phage pi2 protein 07